VTESLTKEERIQLSTCWPPYTKLYLKLLRVHDEMVAAADTAAGDWRELVAERDLAMNDIARLLNERNEAIENLKVCQDTAADTWGVLVEFERERANVFEATVKNVRSWVNDPGLTPVEKCTAVLYALGYRPGEE
jgi:acyl-CoA reductase-like NAD-dependent aldehyde dehydrogenase